jgi:hypothetical protein
MPGRGLSDAGLRAPADLAPSLHTAFRRRLSCESPSTVGELRVRMPATVPLSAVAVGVKLAPFA